MISYIFFHLTFLISLFIPLSIIKTKTPNNPISIYLSFWLILIVISFLNPFNLYDVNFFTYMILFISLFFFCLGFLLISKKKAPYFIIINKYSIRIAGFNNFALVFLFIILIYYLIRFYTLIDLLGYAEARNIKFTQGYLFTSYVEYIFFYYVVSSAVYVNSILVISKFIILKQINFKLLLTILILLIYALIGFGRLIIFDMILFGFIPFFFQPYKFNNSKKRIKFYIFLLFSIFLLIILSTFLTALRNGVFIFSIDEFLYWFEILVKQIVIYFIGPFRALDNFINIVENQNLFLFGRATFSGLEEIFNNILILLNVDLNTANEILSEITSESLSIGPNETFNAFFTGLANFYIDGRLFGVMLVSFILGGFNGFVWNNYLNRNSIASLCLLVFTMKVALSYSYRWDFSSNFSWIILLYLIYLNKKELTLSKKIYYKL